MLSVAGPEKSELLVVETSLIKYSQKILIGDVPVGQLRLIWAAVIV